MTVLMSLVFLTRPLSLILCPHPTPKPLFLSWFCYLECLRVGNQELLLCS